MFLSKDLLNVLFDILIGEDIHVCKSDATNTVVFVHTKHKAFKYCFLVDHIEKENPQIH